MSIKNRTQLKEFFQTNKRPTQAQFADLIDSMVLVNEIPIKPYKVFSAFLEGDSIRSQSIEYTLLENTLGDLNFEILENRISVSPAGNFEFDLSKTFVTIGVINDTCNFENIIFSLQESSRAELIFYCNVNRPSDGTVIVVRDMRVSFENVPIEIRVYEV